MKKITTTLFFFFVISFLMAQVPLNGLVEHFTFNNSLISASGTDTINGTGSFVADKCGNSLSALNVVSPNVFADAGISVPATGNGSRSVSLWCKSMASNAHSLFNYGPVNGCFGLAYDATSGNVLIFGGSQDLTSPLSNASNWNHVVATYTVNGTTALYINGALAASSNTITFLTTTPTTSRIGRSPYSPSTNYDNFLLDDLMIYNRALTAQEVSAIFGAQGGVPAITQQPIFTQNNGIVCVNDDEDAVLSVAATGNGLTYQWKLNGNDIANATDSTYWADQAVPGTFSYSVVIAGSCGSITSNNAILNVYSYPAPTIVQNGALLQTQGFAGGYQWRLNGIDIPGANGPNYTATQNGSYTVAVKNQDQLCEGVSPAVDVDLSVGINDVASVSVSLYPNPAKEVLLIQCHEQVESVEVYNLIGEQVIFERGQITKLNVSELANGVYTLQLTTQNGSKSVRKVVKE